MIKTPTGSMTVRTRFILENMTKTPTGSMPVRTRFLLESMTKGPTVHACDSQDEVHIGEHNQEPRRTHDSQDEVYIVEHNQGTSRNYLC